ncbi:MAG: LarC family nickel insertion protein, partial [Clostridiales Family XIII bacterium]|nr:LarC family nickel insertion protein [Clostridiales Family XIII bacterium]
MKILFFDCSAGISGDMTLGALLHLGADIDRLREELGKLEITGYALNPNKWQKNGITGVNLDVVIQGEDEPARETVPAHEHAHGGADHSHDGNHPHDHGHAHVHPHTHEPGHAHTDAPASSAETGNRPPASEDAHRSFKAIRALIENSALKDIVKKMAIDIFAVIAKAEAAVHDMPVEDVVFHEVGAVDSIVDIVGTAVCVDLLGAEAVYCSPVHDGRGFIRCRHGMIPVPVPAVMEMLKGSDISVVSEDVDTEMVTPTGMGILRGLGAKCAHMPEINVLGVGYGFGKR